VILRAGRLPLRTRNPFVISRTAYTGHENVVVELVTDEGVSGLGEAAPNRYYNETPKSVLAALAVMAPVLRDFDGWALENVDAQLAALMPGDASARAAVSAAMHDILGKRLGAPVYRLFGLDPGRAPLSSFTIPITEPELLRARVEEARQYPILKIKLGTDRDLEIVRMVRDVAPEKRLMVDANAAWSPEHAAGMAESLVAFGVESLEQPVSREDLEGLAFVRDRSPIPVIADESCATSADVPGLSGAVDGINIKLAKCGSIREAVRMVHVARAHGMTVMAGCMIESSLGISAIAQIAPLLDHADLDGPALLAEDPFSGVRMERGRLAFTAEAGLGVSANCELALSPVSHGAAAHAQ
jgi:L-Ala-D/L-Glu epimerase